MTRRYIWTVGIALTLLVGCGSDQRLPALGPDAVVLAFGNSLTFGTGADSEESYPAVLAGLIGREVVNAGVPGETSAEGLRRLPGVLEKTSPALLLLCHGGNDFLRKLDGGQLEGNLRQMVGLAQERGVPVVLVGVPQPGLFLSTAAVYEDLAEELDLPFQGDAVPSVLGDNALKSDAVHPNKAGYQVIAEAIAVLLREAGAVD